jgi:hypothetical protein
MLTAMSATIFTNRKSAPDTNLPMLTTNRLLATTSATTPKMTQGTLPNTPPNPIPNTGTRKISLV